MEINASKIVSPDELKLDEGSREVVAIISTDSVDRAGDVMIPKGLIKKNYQGNPVVLINHDYSQLPIGTASFIQAQGDKVIAKYRITDKTQLGRDVFGLMQDGVLRAHSIGFVYDSANASAPTTKELAANPQWTGAKQVIRKWELLEFSVVTVPCNQECLALAVAKGYGADTVKALGWQKLWEEAGKECWGEWSETAVKAVAQAITEPEKVIPVVKTIEPAKFIRKWSDIEAQLKQLLSGLDSDEFFARLKGQV